jgi:acetyl esterase/lipase
MNSLLLLLALFSSPFTTDTLHAPDGSGAGLWVPSGKGHHPLVIWFHGGLGANNPQKGIPAAANMAATWGDSGAFALLAPSAWPASPWWSDDAAVRVTQLIDSASHKPGVDGSRLVFAGVSDGGIGALWLAARLRSRLGKRLKGVAVWSCDPDVLSSQGATWTPSSLKGIPVRWTAGGKDHLFPLEQIHGWWARCASEGLVIEKHEDPEADHDLMFHKLDVAKFPAWMRHTAK